MKICVFQIFAVPLPVFCIFWVDLWCLYAVFGKNEKEMFKAAKDNYTQLNYL